MRNFLNAARAEAFKKFLKLAPDDPQAPLVKQQIKQLEAAAVQQSATTGSG